MDSEWTRPSILSVGREGAAATDARAGSDELPWSPWELPLLPEATRSATDPQELLRIVRSQPKRNIESLDDVPPHLVTSCRVKTSLERPKALDPRHRAASWYPQLDRAFVLHLQDAFIGDNVVMDCDHYFRLGRWWLGGSWELYRDTREVRHVDRAVSIGGWGGEAFQLFILSALPKLSMLIDLLETPEYRDFRIVSHGDNSRIACWFWRKLGVADRIVPKPLNSEAGFVVHADQVLFPQFDPNLGSYGIYARNTLLPVRRRLGVLAPVEQDKVLFLDRPGQGKFRCVGNREELLGGLRAVLRGSRYRLEVFHSEGDQDADLEVFRRAKVILGPHGGSFANMVFAQPGTHVIEFLPIYRLYAEGAEPRPTFWGLAQAAGLDYWTSEPKVFDFDAPDMIVDVDEVVGIVRRLVEASP